MSSGRIGPLLKSGDTVHVTQGDLEGMTGTVESWEYSTWRYTRTDQQQHERLYWVILDGDSGPVPFLWSQLTRWDEMPEPAAELVA